MYADRQHCGSSEFGWKAVGVWTRVAAEDVERKHVAAPSDRVIVGVGRGPELHGASGLMITIGHLCGWRCWTL